MELKKFLKALLLIVAAGAFNYPAQAQVTFVIDDLPGLTPAADTIFISGAFNDWAVNDPQYMLRKRLDGKYAITLHFDADEVEYKFTRGDWLKVETTAANSYRPNRTLTPADGQMVRVSIANWQDLGGARPLDFSIFVYFAAAFAGLATIYYLRRGKHRQEGRDASIAAFLSVAVLLLTGRTFYDIVPVVWQSYFRSAAPILTLLAGPFLYFVLKPEIFNRKSALAHFIPAAAAATLAALKLFNLPFLYFLAKPVLNSVATWDFVLAAFSGFLSVSLYWAAGFGILAQDKAKRLPHLCRATYGAALAALVLWAANMLALADGQGDKPVLTHMNIAFTGLVIIVAAIGYHVFRKEAAPQRSWSPGEADELRERIAAAMKEKKPYKDPHFSLHDLSALTDIKPHALSKVINDHYGQHFRDFINGYRIEEFIELASRGASRRLTLLALAYEVGFNSKSTFNAAFKKLKGRSPREYLKGERLVSQD